MYFSRCDRYPKVNPQPKGSSLCLKVSLSSQSLIRLPETALLSKPELILAAWRQWLFSLLFAFDCKQRRICAREPGVTHGGRQCLPGSALLLAATGASGSAVGWQTPSKSEQPDAKQNMVSGGISISGFAGSWWGWNCTEAVRVTYILSAWLVRVPVAFTWTTFALAGLLVELRHCYRWTERTKSGT